MEQALDDDSGDRSPPTRHIDQIVQKNTPSVDEEVREVEINRTEEWGPIGLPLFLTPEELEKQGLDLDSIDKAIVRIQDGFLLIDSQ